MTDLADATDTALLTTDENKRCLYERDPYFREAWSDLTGHWGSAAAPRIREMAVLVFKPETVMTRRIPAGLDVLNARGFVPVAHRLIRYTRHMNRAAWRFQYQSDAPSVDRLAVNDLQLSSTAALCVVARDGGAGEQPAAVRLNSFKGSMSPLLRRPGELRSIVGGPNRMLSGVHIPDEPADVVRELAILFDPPERRALLTEVDTAHANTELDQTVSDLHQQYPADLSGPREVLERLLHRAAADPVLTAFLSDVERGGALDWGPFLSHLDRAGIPTSIWERVLIGTEYILKGEGT